MLFEGEFFSPQGPTRHTDSTEINMLHKPHFPNNYLQIKFYKAVWLTVAYNKNDGPKYRFHSTFMS